VTDVKGERHFLHALEAVLFPSRCQICGCWLDLAGERVLCKECAAGLAPWRGPRCPICGIFLPTPDPSRCGRCAVQPPSFRAHRSWASYGGALRRALHLFKYHDLDGVAPLFQAGLVQIWYESGFPPMDGIVPVPADPTRHRDFSPTLRLAELLARETGIPLWGNVLKKKRTTPPQAGLSQARRLTNLKGAFTLRGAVAGKRLLLLDDVMTTGTTLRTCGDVLTRGGSEVFALTLAQTPLARSLEPS